MQRRVLHADKMVAVKELTAFMVSTAGILSKSGWTWYASGDRAITESFTALKKCGNSLPISIYGSEGTVYGDRFINSLNRFWHDVTHLQLDLGYSLEEEYKVIRSQLTVMELHGLSPLAREIFWCDMWGQALYYDRYCSFVENQNAFVDSCLRHGITTATIAKH